MRSTGAQTSLYHTEQTAVYLACIAVSLCLRAVASVA
jgi:hypothetical protein